RLILGNRLEGPPFLHLRSVASERAVLRVGRREKLLACVLNLGGEARGVHAELVLPEGVTCPDGRERTVPILTPSGHDLIAWTLEADRPLTGEVSVRVSVPGGSPAQASCAVRFLPPVAMERTGYVPEPVPAVTPYTALMHYCALWKEGTHYGWGRIEPWPERRPAIGFYDEGTPEVADWHIKYALEHGISGFIYCWYRTDLEPEIHQMLGHAIHEGLFEARYRDRFRFCIMWENGCAQGVRDAADLLDNLFPFWMKHYFTHPSYLRLDNMPVLFVWRPEKVGPQLGGAEGTRRAFDAMRERAREAGCAGLRIIGCLDRANPVLQQRLAAEGWDATSGYALFPAQQRIVGTDVEGIPFCDHAEVTAQSRAEWEARRAAGSLPDIPNVMMGWDPRPWHGRATRLYRANPTAGAFEAACRDARALVDETPTDAWYRNLVVLDNWTEFGEGHYIEPTSGTGFAYVNAIRRVFCTSWAEEGVTDIVPEDVGLAPPERRYAERRALFGGSPWRPRVIRDHLIGWWSFDDVRGEILPDSSASGFHLVGRKTVLAPGRSGKALGCGEGWASHPGHPQLFPPSGLTVSAWCKPSRPEQNDRWLVNTVGGGSNGYRLGLHAGCAVWQVPRELWSHILRAPNPLPVDAWSHLAATFDNRLLRLYVDGKLVGEMERSGLLRPSDADLNIGTFAAERARFEGALDDLRLHDRALSAAEIEALYRAERPQHALPQVP
ncbi:MAG: glycoside hydrolase family 99-like domain-containing protein, partial [Lentisphaeria bacterium]|nr:glycoside hydrolase family 99-like domain-containing protein [Lentisphaeria bacterium]